MSDLLNWGATCLCATIVTVVQAAPAAAQPRPLRTEDSGIDRGRKIAVQMGVDYLRDQSFPVSGLRGHYTNVPNIGLRFGTEKPSFRWSTHRVSICG